MNSGLRYLIRAVPRGFVRGITRRFTGTQGVLAIVAGACVLLVLLASQLLMYLKDAAPNPEEVAERLANVRALGPLSLTAFLFMLDLSGKGLFFRPAEIDFLMPAPISRRQLLVYHLVSRASVQVLSGLWISMFTLRLAGNLVGGLIATILALLFLQIAGEVWSLLVAAAGQRFGGKVRVIVWGAVVAAVAVAVRAAAAAAAPDASFVEMLRGASDSPYVVAVTLPARPFIEAFAAESFLQAIPWLLAALGVMFVAVVAVLRLDFAFEESALAASQKLQDRLRSMKSGEGAFVASKSALTRKVPRLPLLSGAGPIAHRQLTEFARNPTSVLWSAGAMAFMVALLLWFPHSRSVQAGQDVPAPVRDLGVPALILTLALSTFMNQGFPYDFRRDLDRMATLKALPVPAWIVAAGQLITPALVFTVTQWCLFALIAAKSNVSGAVLLAVSAVAFPWNWLSATLDNAMFLVLPYRIDPEDPANMPFLGRLAASMAVKGFALAIVGGLVALCMVPGIALGGVSGVALVALGVLLASVAAAVGTLAVALAFRNFDVARDG